MKFPQDIMQVAAIMTLEEEIKRHRQGMECPMYPYTTDDHRLRVEMLQRQLALIEQELP